MSITVRRITLALVVLVTTSLTIGITSQQATADTPFSPQFSTNAPGDIEYVANTVATCAATVATCAAAQAGGNSTNNGFGANMILVDVDGDPTTATSSTATYTLPAGGDILWAGLYWTGYYQGANGDKDDVQFSTPASGGYVPITATWFDDWNSNDDYYAGFADVTALVDAGGSGTYGVGDIAVTPGTGSTYGGWTLIIVEEDPAEPWKNLTVNHGFQIVSGTNTVPITISGFTAPPTGPVNAEIGVVAGEGDIGFGGDFAQFNGTNLGDALNPTNNFFNSSLTNNGVYNTGLNPSYPANTLGFDANIINTSGLVTPGSTSANVNIGTNGDGFFPIAVTTAIEIFVPNFNPNLEKTSTDLNGEDLHPGDVIEYTIAFDNSGEDAGIDNVLTDTIPTGTTYIPGSLEIIQDDSPAGPRTDAAGDDNAWFDGSAVHFNLGVGADATNGGRIIPVSDGGGTYEVSFQVTVDEGTEFDTITNSGDLNFIAEFINEPFSASTAETSDEVLPLVDLKLDKVDDTDPVVAGQQITYTLNVTNDGPSDAQNVVITDPLPVGTTFNAGASDSGCSVVGSVVTCALGTVADGDTVSPKIVVDVDGDLSAIDVCNKATVTSDTHEHDTSNNTDAECTKLQRLADVGVTKSAPATIAAGNQMTYTVTVTNDGPSDAQNVVATDVFPSGLSIISTTPSGTGTCSGSITCTWAEIVDGGSETITIVAEVPASSTDGTIIENSVTVSSDDPDNNDTNDSAETTTTVETSADLLLDKSTTTVSPVAGGSLAYSLTVTNDGPSDAQNVVVTDPIPAGLTFDPSMSSGACQQVGSDIVCTAPVIADGASTSFTVAFTVNSSLADGTSITNTAGVSADTDDPNEKNNKASSTDTIDRSADLSVIKDDNITTINAGEQITYTLSYANGGPSDATGVVITDTLPAGLTFASSSSCTASGQTVTCTIGNVANGASGSVQFTVDSDPTLADDSQQVNLAEITGNETDPNTDNNSSSVSTDINRLSELVLEKDDLADPVIAGQTATYRLRLENVGPSSDTGVTITDPLPAGTTFVSSTQPSTCSHASGTVTCNIGTMASGQVFTVDIVVTIDSDLTTGTILSNTATADGTFSPEVDDTEETTINTSADIGIEKSAPIAAVAGTSMIYILEVTNDGPSDAVNITVSDTLPTGVTYASSTATGGATCSNSGATVTCTAGSIPANGSILIEISVDIAANVADGTTITNDASASSTTPDPDTDNNTGEADTTIARAVDLTIEKAAIVSPVASGTQAQYTITVTNNGPSDATGITVNETLPPGFTFNAADSDVACQPAGTCTAAILAPTDSITFTIVADVNSNTTPGTYTNKAGVSSNETETDPDDNTTTADIEVVNSADLLISKVGDDPVFTPGTTETYTITIGNDGPSDATGVVISDSLPAGLTFNPTGSDPACGVGVTCNIATLPAGTVQTLTIVVDVDADVSGDIVNTATISADTTDPDPDNNSGTDTTPAEAQADLSLTKTAATEATAGETLTYTLTVRNDGPSDANNTTVTDILPAGLTFQPTGSSASCLSGDGTTVTCNLGTLIPNQVVTITIVTDVGSDVAHNSDVENDASVESDATDPDGSDNDASAETTIEREVDVQVLKTASVSEVTAGAGFSYTITVSNAGPSDAANVSVGDTLPAGVVASSVTTTLGTCGNSGTSFGCSVPSMASTDTMVITVAVDVDPSVADATVLNNSATASSDDPDTNTDNNTDDVDVTVETSADIQTTKVADLSTVTAGEQLIYTVEVTNDGPSDAQNLVVTDTVPAELEIDSVGSADFDCTIVGQLITCTLSALADQDSAQFDIITNVDPETSGDITITNSATTTSDTNDPDPDNNTGTEQTDVDKLVDLQVAKSTTKSPAVAGEPQPYVISVSNDGPSTATNVVITDTLPVGTSLNTTLSDGSCTETVPGTSTAGPTITCSITSISADTTVAINVVVDIPTDYTDGATLTNTATAEADEPDSNPDDNTSSVDTPVVNSADLSIVKDGDPLVTAGTSYTWTLTVQNFGPSDADSVVITDTLPAGTTFDDAASDSRCDAIGLTVTCLLPTMSANTTDTFELVVDVDSSVADEGSLANTATISSDTDDPTEGNNMSSDEAGVVRTSELDINKIDLTDPAVAGEELQWEIEVENLGPSDAANVTLVDALPAGTSFVSVDDPNCSHATGTVSCLWPSLAAGSTVTIVLTVDVDAATGDNTTIANTATANSDTTGEVDTTEETTIQRQSDLEITKTSDGDAVAGTNQTYIIEVTNNGPSDADDVTVTDYLPAGVTFVSASIPGCTDTTGVVTCDLGTLADQQTVTFELEVLITDAAGSTPQNAVDVTSSSTDPDPSNNDDTDDTNVTFEADLSAQKELLANPIIPGENATWELTVTNAGPSIANNVTAVDVLPVGFQFVTAGSDSACTGNGQTVTCTESDLLAGETITFTVVTAVDSDLAADVVNTVDVESETPDPNPEDNTASTSGPVTPQANLDIQKQLADAPLVAGENATYNIEVHNNGPSDATNVTITDTIPSGAGYVPGLSSANCQQQGADVTCSIPNIPAGETANVAITLVVDQSFPDGTTLTNTASVSSDTEDPDPENNTSSDENDVEAEADLDVVKSGPSAPVVAGENFTYTIKVENAGPSDAQNVELTDALPAGVTLVSLSDPAACSLTGTTVTCNVAVLPAGTSQTFSIEVATDASLAEGSAILNTATGSSDTNDPDEDNNSDDQTVTIGRSTELELTKSADPQPVVAGTTMTYSLLVTNLGPSVSDNVTVVDELPAGTTFVSADAACSISGTTVTCIGGTLNPSDVVEFQVTVLVGADTGAMSSLVNNATATGDNAEPTTEGEEVEVDTSADLSLTKVLNEDLVAGETASYTLTATNFGPSDAQDVEITDALPAGITYVSDTGDCNMVGAAIICETATLPAGQTLSIEIIVLVEPWVDDDFELTNNAGITSTTPDPDLTNNTAEANAQPATQADLQLTKSVTDETLPAGETTTYTFSVTNNGPSDAADVVIVDALPASLTFNSDGSDAACAASGQTVTCTRPTLPVDETWEVVVAVDVAADAVGELSNSAEVTSSTSDPDLEGNSATATAPVENEISLQVNKTAQQSGVTAGETIDWTIEVVNLGPATATDVTITDPLPQGLTYVSHSVAGSDLSDDACTATAATLTCIVSTLAVDSPLEITLTTAVSAEAAAGQLSNTATAVGSSGQTNGTAEADAQVTVSAAPVPESEQPADGSSPGEAASSNQSPNRTGLPFTGSNLGFMLGLAALLLSLGWGSRKISRRNRA